MRFVHISELVPADEIICWMRLGLALQVSQRGDTSLYRSVPHKTKKAKFNDLTKFNAWVLLNNPAEKVITVQVTRTDRNNTGFNTERPSLVADISYTAFRKVQLLSKAAIEANPENLTFPANLADAKFRHYRTLVEVRLV
jgi:hypothetical protein